VSTINLASLEIISKSKLSWSVARTITSNDWMFSVVSVTLLRSKLNLMSVHVKHELTRRVTVALGSD